MTFLKYNVDATQDINFFYTNTQEEVNNFIKNLLSIRLFDHVLLSSFVWIRSLISHKFAGEIIVKYLLI